MTKQRSLKTVLALVLALTMLIPGLPVAMAEGTSGDAEMSSSTEGGSEQSQLEGSQVVEESAQEAGETLQSPSSPSEGPSLSEDSGPLSPPAVSDNKISGSVWFDENEDGIWDTSEGPLPDVAVSLYAADDLSAAIEGTTTDSSGTYTFSNLEPGSYKVGVQAQTIDGSEYLIPMKSVQSGADNKFDVDWSTDPIIAASESIALAADAAVTDIDAGMRTAPGIQLMALSTYYIDITSAATVSASIAAAGGSIPGITYASNVLTFTTAVDPTDTYILTGTPNVNRVIVNTGVEVNITLGGLSITNATQSPFQLVGTAKVHLTLGAGTTNVVRCTATTTNMSTVRTGLYVPAAAMLTIDGTGELQATGTYACAGIGGSGATGGECGNITINGGTVTATGGNGGAGIGSGGDGIGGTITINGGTVTATGGINGAGIGTNGVVGTINISGGTVNATGGVGGGGAGIGGNAGGAGGTITISGGAVNATASGNGGAGIGGGWSGAGGTITISGGAVNATGVGGGAGVGGGLFAAGGTINISGGVVKARGGAYYASSIWYGGAGIGGGYTGAAATSLAIGAGAEIYAYSVMPNQPALHATTITGTGYYVNAWFGDGALSTTNDFDLRIHSGNYVGSYVDSIPLPALYYCFAYTTGGSSKIYNTRAINTGTGIDEGHVVEYTTYNPNILLSVNGGSAAGAANLYKVRLWPLPFLGDLSHSNVTYTTADVTSTDHSFSTAVNNEGYFDYDLDGTFTSGNFTRVPWSSTTTNPYTENLTSLTPNTLYSYRVYLKNEYGDTTSMTKQFLTLPQISSWNAAGTSITDSIVSGSITASDNNNPITGVTVTIADDSGFTTNVQSITLTSGAPTNGYTDTSFTANFGILTAGTYHVKVEVSNVTGLLGGVTTETTSFTVYAAYPVTETYVGLSNGTQIDSVGLPDTTVNVAGSYTPAAGVPPTSHTVGGNTYTYLGYRLDSYTPGQALTSGTPSGVTITGPRTVCYVYEVLVDVVISKTVSGDYADLSKSFTFDMYFKDSLGTSLASGTTYSYTTTNPTSTGTLTLDALGKAAFTLKHNQTITVEGVLSTGQIQVVETTDINYNTSIVDSITGAISGNDTGTLAMTSADRAIDFTNARKNIPLTGIDVGGDTSLPAMFAGLIVVVACALAARTLRRRRIRRA